jgi:hypothetical protein
VKPIDPFDLDYTWHNAGEIAEQAVWDAANRAKDKADEARDSMRVHNGQTLDEFLSQK